MKLFAFTFALICATSSVFAQAEETTTIAPVTEASSTEVSTDAPTTVAPSDSETTTEAKEPEAKQENVENRPEGQGPGPNPEFMGGRTGGAFFPQPQDPRVMFVPQTVRDPVTGMIYHRRVPNFGPPNPNFRPPMQPPMTQPSFDPLGSYSEHQKKRQFFQDLLMNQLSRFEKEVDPMVEQETDEAGKGALVQILQAVHNLKKALENNQIFNISEIMKTWKEGKLPGQNAPPTESGAAVPPPQGEAPVQPEQPPAEVVAVAEASPQVRAILILPQRQERQPQLLYQREPQHPMYIRRYAVPQEEQQLPPRGYAPQEHGYIAGY